MALTANEAEGFRVDHAVVVMVLVVLEEKGVPLYPSAVVWWRRDALCWC